MVGWPSADLHQTIESGRDSLAMFAGLARLASRRRRTSGYHRVMIDQTGVILRPAAVDDAERIAALFTDEGYPAGPSDIVSRLERFESIYSRVVVADHEGELLGFVAFHA